MDVRTCGILVEAPLTGLLPKDGSVLLKNISELECREVD